MAPVLVALGQDAVRVAQLLNPNAQACPPAVHINKLDNSRQTAARAGGRNDQIQPASFEKATVVYH